MCWFKFSEIEEHVEAAAAGLYEIRVLPSEGLKVGTSVDLRKRLKQHRGSWDSGLKLKPGRNRECPRSVISKKSILAKHLYYDEEIALGYDLKSESGRRAFLEANCRIKVTLTRTLVEAKQLENQIERSGQFRYVGRVLVRRPGKAPEECPRPNV